MITVRLRIDIGWLSVQGMIDPNTGLDIENRGEVVVTKEQFPQKIKVMLLPIIPIILKHVKSDTIIVTVL